MIDIKVKTVIKTMIAAWVVTVISTHMFFLIKVPFLKIFFQQAFQRVYIFLDPLFQKGFKKYAFIIFFNGGLAWEPSFVCKLNFSFKFKLLKLEFLNQAKHIFVVLSNEFYNYNSNQIVIIGNTKRQLEITTLATRCL